MNPSPMRCIGRDEVHTFKPRFDELWPTDSHIGDSIKEACRWEDASAASIVLDSLKNRVYRGDICVKCGLFLSPEDRNN